MDILSEIYDRMIAYESGNPRRIQHFIKVHSFASRIGKAEGLSSGEQFVLEAAALTHDIGIRPALEKYGSSAGPLQEKEGPPQAEALLKDLPLSEKELSRIKYLIGHHHTYTDMDGKDYQILVEADFLVNLFEGNESAETVRTCLKNIFRTECGKRILREMFLVP